MKLVKGWNLSKVEWSVKPKEFKEYCDRCGHLTYHVKRHKIVSCTRCGRRY